mmetsp:Transcript_17188/g.41002  ORF Transcript_17188/g.41002 Transcript_17188/m.41002 type:complete len:273 (-) Transcript_17188:142-960(-)
MAFRKLLQDTQTACDGVDMIWGLPGGAAAFLFALLGFVLGTLCGSGAVYLYQKRSQKSSKRRAPGGWRISGALARDTPRRTGGYRFRESADDTAFANILKQTVAKLGGLQSPKMLSCAELPRLAENYGGISEAQAGPTTGASSASNSEGEDGNRGGTAMHDSVASSQLPKPDGPSNKPSVVGDDGNRACEQVVGRDRHTLSIDSEYDLDDLDDAWIILLQKIDERMIEGGKPTMDARERAVAIRSLLATTSHEGRDEALQRSIADVESFRRR